nr:hypothetical protein [Paraburkholderia panacisoli]
MSASNWRTDGVIFDDEYVLPRAGFEIGLGAGRGYFVGFDSAGFGQIQGNGRPASNSANDCRKATRLPSETVDHRQTEPGALADRLRREEWREGLFDDVWRHAFASIRDRHGDIVPRLHVATLVGIKAIDLDARRFEGQHAAVWLRVLRVDTKVEQCVFQLVGVTPASALNMFKCKFDFDVLPYYSAEQVFK